MKMFDDYDNKKEFTPLKPFRPFRPEDRLIGTGACKLLKDLKGKEYGVSAPRGSIFTLWFSFEGEVENGHISDLLTEANFSFQILDHRYNAVYETDVTVYPTDQVASVDIVSDGVNILPYGNYFCKLDMEYESLSFSLINERSMILSIE